MMDIEKAQKHYTGLIAFVADVELMTISAQGDNEKELDGIRVLAYRLAKKWKNAISEALYQQQFGDNGAKAETTTAPVKAKAKAGVRVLQAEEEM